MQLNIGHLNEDGTYNGQFTTFALAGKVRAQVRGLVAQGRQGSCWPAGWLADRLAGGPPGRTGNRMWVEAVSRPTAATSGALKTHCDSSERSGRLADGGGRLHSCVLSAAGSWRQDAGCLPATAAGVDSGQQASPTSCSTSNRVCFVGRVAL